MRVLVADDNRDFAESLAVLLCHWGFEPVTVHDGNAALAILRETDVSVLTVLDWMMPGVNGIDVCREIRKDAARPYSYIILMTGRSEREHMLDGLNAGADDYLIKPVDPNELHARLNTGKRILDLQAQLLKSQHQLREQATRDSLTGLWNRAMILETLQRELARSQREAQPMAVVMADVDHFKTINDTHGHLAGDHVLRQIAQRLQGALRHYDAVGRYGGEEFLCVFPNCDCDASLALAERLRLCVEEEAMSIDGAVIHATVSLGVAMWDGSATAKDLLHRADGALYRAKAEGRNRVVLAEAAPLRPL